MIRRVAQALLVLIVILVWLDSVYGQSSSKLTISSKAEQLSDELVDRNERDKNGQICAGLVIVSDLTGFTFESYNGIVKSTHQPGRDLLFLSPDERVVTLYKSGYEPLKIFLRDLGISLKSGTVWQVKITGEKKDGLLNAVIIVTTADAVVIPDAVVIVDGIRRGAGKSHQVAPGKHTIRVEKDGFGPKERVVDVSATLFEFNFALKEVDVVLTTINSLPAGAALTVDGADKGRTDRSLYLYPGTYRLRLEKVDYLPVDTAIVIRDGSENRFRYALVRNLGSLTLSIRPADANVTVNQRKVDASKLVELPPGEYEVVAAKVGYLPQTIKVAVPRGGEIAKAITLERNAGTLNLSVSPPAAQVRINREEYAARGSGELAPGTYRVEVFCAGYDSLSETITIVRGATLEKRFSLRQKVGRLQFNVVPVTAGVVLTRDGVKVDEWTGAKYLRDLPVGAYELTCRHSGYKTSKQNIQIDERKPGKVEIIMREGTDLDLSLLGIKWILIEGGPGEDFSMSATEVTFDQYDAFCNATGHEKPKADFGRGKQPVINVNLTDAVAFCDWVSRQTGKTVRLPEEDEWEFAAKGGKKGHGYEYSGSSNPDEVGWYYLNSGSKTHEVAAKRPNELGLYDMSGNVWEWCRTRGVIRGGSWGNLDYNCRVSNRDARDASNRGDDLGFRLARSK